MRVISLSRKKVPSWIADYAILTWHSLCMIFYCLIVASGKRFEAIIFFLIFLSTFFLDSRDSNHVKRIMIQSLFVFTFMFVGFIRAFMVFGVYEHIVYVLYIDSLAR